MNSSPFTFSISAAIQSAWQVFTRHLRFFVVLGIISILFMYAGDSDRMPLWITMVANVGSLLWSVVWLKASLAAARNDESRLSLVALRDLLPTLREAGMLVGIALFTVLIVLCGLILLIIPGIYVAIRLAFGNLAYLDRREGIQKSVRYSWDITKGTRFWTAALTVIVVILFGITGALFFGVGLLIAYPICMILMAILYVRLSAYHGAMMEVIEQPLEIEKTTGA